MAGANVQNWDCASPHAWYLSMTHIWGGRSPRLDDYVFDNAPKMAARLLKYLHKYLMAKQLQLH